jgi:hypothetical protein
MKAWRENAAPKISSLQSRVDEVLGRVGDIGVQLDEVLRPVTGAITRLSSQLASLDALSDEVSGRAEPPSENGDGAIVIELPDEQAARPDAWRPR